MDKTLSVIIPNYNNERYISKCIDSVLMQTYPIEEIIIYDDASTDNSVEILRNYTEKSDKIKVIYGKDNIGVSYARMRAIEEAVGEYVTTLDADDYYWDIDKLKNEMFIINNTNDKICVFSQTIDVDENGIPIKPLKKINLNNRIRFKMLTRLFGAYMPRDFCVSREILLKAGGYDYDLKLYEDWDLELRLLKECNFVYSGSYGIAYRHKAQGLSKVKYDEHLKSKVKIFEKNRQLLNCSAIETMTFYLLSYFNYYRHLFLG